MPVRIFALAKDWKMESKELADLCVKAGITGKGSVLASLDDDEIAKLKSYLENTQKKQATSAAAAPATAAPERSRVGAPIRPGNDQAAPLGAGKKPLVLAPKKTVGEAPPPAPVEAEKTPEITAVPEPAQPVEAIAPTPPEQPAIVLEKAPPPVTPSSESTSVPAPPEPVARDTKPAPLRREDFSPSRGKGPIRVMGGGKSADSNKKRDDGGPPAQPRTKEPAIRLAAMPNVKQPEAKQVVQPTAMKPKIRLTAENLKSGGPLESVLKRLEKPKVEPAAGKKGKSGAPADVALDASAPLSGQAKGKRTRPDQLEEAGGGMDALRKARAANRSTRAVGGREEDESGVRRPKKSITRIKGHTTTAPRKGKVQIELPCTIRSFCEQAGVTSAQVMKVLMGMGMMLNINAPIPDEYVELISSELGLDLEIKSAESLEQQQLQQFQQEEDPTKLQIRPPIVTFLGHVDHGKTSLLDRIIGTNVVAGEAGGITQHIRAYSIKTKSGRPIAFVDTPGHEAFTEMRARGANVTDVAVLVVAADDGIMRQTEEAISHAKAANVPIVVAMNKIDLPGANPQRVLEQLAANELLPSEWGGQVEVVRTSAMTGQGMDELLDTLLLTADLFEYKANPDRSASGTCLEAEQEPERGVIAKVMVRNGTLHEGDVVVCGAAHGRVKAMYDTLNGNKLTEAGPSTPVNLTGLDIAPNAGDVMYVLDDIGAAREIAAQRATQSRERSLSGVTKKVSLEEFQRRLTEGVIGRTAEKVTLNLIIRADVRGSIEAINNEFAKFEHPEVQIRVLQSSVGGISVADVTLASASDAVIVGFNVIPDEAARALAEERQVEIRRYDIIYKLTDDIKAMLEGKLKPEEKIIETGRVVVKQVFNISRVGAVAGCYVIQGEVHRSSRIRVFRDGRIVGDYAIDTLKREKDDVKEVSRGMECGIKLQNFNDIKQDDVFEVYKVEEVARTL